MNERLYWADVATRIANPILTHLEARTLHARMPIETSGSAERRQFAHLEAFGRLIAGIAPWLELGEPETASLAEQFRTAIDAVTDPGSPDFCNFTTGNQPLVDTAFFAQGLLRAPTVLWEPLDRRVKNNVLNAFRSTRAIYAPPCNWLLFSAMIEVALFAFGETDWDRMRIDYALRQHEHWYKGDGFYGDGPNFHADYYNSFVIHPMLVDTIRYIHSQENWSGLEERIYTRAQRYAEILERMISPEGTFPLMGRSITYRFASMQTLSQMALLHRLPATLQPSQVRSALSAVIRRMIEAPGTFDDEGWLRIGFCGAQPSLGENYISTGSLYLCSTGLLPLGLSATDPFWADPSRPWTSVKAWNGEEIPRDHALPS